MSARRPCPAFCVVSVTVKLALAAAVAGGSFSAVTTRSAVAGAHRHRPRGRPAVVAPRSGLHHLRGPICAGQDGSTVPDRRAPPESSPARGPVVNTPGPQRPIPRLPINTSSALRTASTDSTYRVVVGPDRHRPHVQRRVRHQEAAARHRRHRRIAHRRHRQVRRRAASGCVVARRGHSSCCSLVRLGHRHPGRPRSASR